MSQITNISVAFPEPNSVELKKFLKKLGVEIKESETGFQARFGDAVISWYKSGKLLIQGKDASDLAEELYLMGLIKTGWMKKPEPRIGVDESGKGDYFGPLVVAGALVEPDEEHQLIRLGVRDSKQISDNSIRQIAGELQKILPHSKVVIGPKRYNELHQKMRNVNRILAWAHARAIENLLEKHHIRLAVSDQFGDESYLLSALLEKGKEIKLLQRAKGEEDLAVASASIIARAEFLSRLEQLSREFGIDLPKGISEQTIEAGKKLVAKSGVEVLEEVAKLHFKTTIKIQENSK